jgi:dTDP-4-amino-4,6-dideoxygalactose transaminase
MGGGGVAAELAGRGLSLPSSADLSDTELTEVADALIEALDDR